MNNKHFLGKRVASFEAYDAVGPITGIALLIDDDNEIIAGTDDGYVMEIECPYGTQAMANNLLSSLQGKSYHGYRSEAAELVPEAELGDGITVNNLYSMLAYRSVAFGGGHLSEIAAPGESELEHEYPYKSQAERQIERKIATTRSMITKTAEKIRLEVSKELDGLSSSIEAKLDGITLETIGADGKVSSVKLFDTGKIDLTGFVTFTGLSGGTTTIDGACIKTGEISAERINLTGSITWSDLSKSVQNEFGDGLTEDDVSTLITSELVSSPNIAGGKFKDIKQKNWIEMGQVQTSGGKTTIAYFNHYCSGYSTSNPVFVMGYTNPTTAAANWVMAPFNTIVLDYLKTNETMYASGNWDFSGANVSGLGIDADGVKVVPVWG